MMHKGWINLKEKRYDIKTELNDPFAGFNKLSAQANYTDYQHTEMAGDTPDTRFNLVKAQMRVLP